MPVLLNIQSRSDLLNYFLEDSNATLAVCEASLASSFDAETLEGTSVGRVVMVNGSDELCGRVPESAFVDGESDELACADTGSEDMAFWMYSSGSTGRPKGIVHLHQDMAYTHQSFGSHVLRLREDDRCFSVPKIFFAYGFGNSLTFPFSVGATTVLMPGRPEAGAVLDVIERFRPTVFFGLPTLYTALCRVAGIRDRDLGSLRQSMSAAEVLSEETYSSWKALAGHGPVEGLGSTEMLHIYLSNRLDDHRLGAAGARVPGYEVKLTTPEGDPVRSGEEGVMLVRGDSSAPCYWQKPEKSRETMRDDWIDTGDRFVERDGYYYFRGRTDELIKISGQWVWPLEVERCLNEHPHVHECAVLAHELPGRRMTLRAVVRLGDCVEESDATRTLLQQFVKNRLLPFQVPAHRGVRCRPAEDGYRKDRSASAPTLRIRTESMMLLLDGWSCSSRGRIWAFVTSTEVSEVAIVTETGNRTLSTNPEGSDDLLSCRLQTASARTRIVRARTDNEPDNDHTNTPSTTRIGRLFFLSFAELTT